MIYSMAVWMPGKEAHIGNQEVITALYFAVRETYNEVATIQAKMH